MEEKNNLTAERSLEIITEQIERSRRTVSKSTGQSLYAAGICTMGMAVVVAIVNLLILQNGFSPLGHLLWLVLPVIIWLALRNIYKRREPAPVSLIGTLVGKTWWTFAFIVLGFFLLAILWNFVLSHSVEDPMAYMVHHVRIQPIIILLMGMAVAITGHILKSKWLVWFGVIASLVIAIGDFAGLGTMILARVGVSPSMVVRAASVLPCLSVLFFAFFGLMLPGLLLKRERL